MEAMVRKYQNKFRKVREDMAKWNDLQSRLLSLFGNAVSVIERLPLLVDVKNYEVLRVVRGIEEALVAKQIESLEGILSSMKETMNEVHCIVQSLEKTWRDCQQQLKSCSKNQLQQRIGIHPSLALCLEGFKKLYEMHLSEYLLKESIISSMMGNTRLHGPNDLNALLQLLSDQPNIPKDEVQLIFDTILAEEID